MAGFDIVKLSSTNSTKNMEENIIIGLRLIESLDKDGNVKNPDFTMASMFFVILKNFFEENIIAESSEEYRSPGGGRTAILNIWIKANSETIKHIEGLLASKDKNFPLKLVIPTAFSMPTIIKDIKNFGIVKKPVRIVCPDTNQIWELTEVQGGDSL